MKLLNHRFDETSGLWEIWRSKVELIIACAADLSYFWPICL